MPNRQRPNLKLFEKGASKKALKPGSGALEIIDGLKNCDGWGKYDRQAGFKDGKLHLPGINFLVRLQDLKELTRPDNPTPYMVEFVHIGQSSYLHLVKKPPREVLKAISQKGAGHYTATNDIGPFLDTLDVTPPKPTAPKPPAKKANPVPEQAPAKTPKQLAEEELSKVIKTAKVGSPEYKIAIAKRDAMRTLDIVRERAKKGPKS